jgi:alkylated DNA repair protein (DNA oxidative demethylase)
MTKDYGSPIFMQGCGSKGTAPYESPDLPEGCRLIRGRLAPLEQQGLVAELRKIMAQAPLYHPHMPRTGRPFSVAMTNCGPLGWFSDKERGYRYESRHPHTRRPWPPMPDILLRLWHEVTAYPAMPEACLVNHYSGKARMGLHRDEDEGDFCAPIVSVSLGDSAVFRIGGLKRRDPTVSFPLNSGDVLVMGGPSRLIYHGIDRILPGSSSLLPEGGRINLTLRRVTRPEG